MKNISTVGKKRLGHNIAIGSKKDDTQNFQYFYFVLISFLIVIDILFQKGIPNLVITRTWGINNLSYFPWWTQALVFSILLLFSVPPVNNNFRLFIQKLTVNLREKKPGKTGKLLWFICISFFIALLFYLFKVKFDLLGDMDLRVSQSVDGKYINDEYFTMYLLHYANIFFSKHFLIPHQTFVIHSIVSGFFYCFLGLLMADLLFDDLYFSIPFFLFYISIGTLLVFCGYVEIYAIPATSVSLYIYASLLHLKGKVAVWLPLFCLLLAVAFHLEQISLLPSFLFLTVRNFKISKFINTRIILLLALISVPVIYLLNAHFNLTSLTPLAKSDTHPNTYTVLSFTHFWELFNAEYISSGVLLFLFIIIIIQIWRKKIKEDVYSLFLLIIVSFSTVIVFAVNKERGSADWDICSFPAISLSLFIGYVTLTQWKIRYSPRKLFYTISVALLLNAIGAYSWIGINSSKLSLKKIQDMLLTDPGYYYTTTLPGEWELAILLRKCGERKKALEYYKISYDRYSSVSSPALTNYVFELMEDKDTNTAVSVLEKAMADHPLFFNSYNVLFQIYSNRKENAKIYNGAKAFVAVYNQKPNLILGDAQGRDLLNRCFNYLSGASLSQNDTSTYRDIVTKMKQLNMNVPITTPK